MLEVLRQEKKYLLPLPEARRLGDRLSHVMREDSHSGPEGYTVRSLYYDTLDDTDFTDKVDGMELRRKIRLRCYDPSDDFAVLEMKQKEGNFQKKRSLRLTRADAMELIRGEYSSLLRYREAFAGECYGLLHARCYRPRAVVEYRRRAFLARENRIRITLDSSITATESSWDLFCPDLCQYPVMDPFHTVLEVKSDAPPSKLVGFWDARGKGMCAPLLTHPVLFCRSRITDQLVALPHCETIGANSG